MDSPKPNDEGMTHATLIVSTVSAVTLLLMATFFLWFIGKERSEFKDRLHTQETEAAYKFTWVKNQLNQMQNKCSGESEKVKKWIKFNEQHPAGVKPPLDQQVAGDCVVAEQMPEKGGH